MDRAEEEQLFAELKAIGDERAAIEARRKELSKEAPEAAKDALRRGMRPSRIAKALGYTDGYVRKLRIDAKLPPDPRYAGNEPPKRHIGFGSVGIGDTTEEAIANAGPLDYGEDLRALVMATARQRIVDLVERLRREDADWYQSVQAVVGVKSGDVAVETLVHALAENRLSPADFAS